MSRRTSIYKGGFTIIELLIATVVFSLVVMVITVSIMQFTKQYYGGTVASTTQSTARALVDDVTRSIQYNKSGIYELKIGADVRGYCMGGSKRYSFMPFQKVSATKHGLVADVPNGGCNSTADAPLNLSSATTLSTPYAREMLGERMRLAKFKIEDQTNGLWLVTVKVVYGDDDLLTSTTADTMQCKPGSGSQFCAVSELTTTVKRRVN